MALCASVRMYSRIPRGPRVGDFTRVSQPVRRTCDYIALHLARLYGCRSRASFEFPHILPAIKWRRHLGESTRQMSRFCWSINRVKDRYYDRFEDSHRFFNDAALREFFIDQWTSHKRQFLTLLKRTMLVGENGEKLRIKFIAVVNYECNYDAWMWPR